MQTQHDHSIKVNRAFSLAGIGRYPGSASAMLQAIPPAMIAALTAAQIAAIMDANWALAQASKAIRATEALVEGGIWDGTQFRRLAQ